MGKISDYTRVLVSKLTDVFACDQTDNGTTETKSATVEQIGTAIGTLQNFADLDTSNKTLVDAINEIASYTPVYGNTASGAIATFDTSLALPLQDLQIAINAVQESGTPTPSSPKAISGFTGANVGYCDFNQIRRDDTTTNTADGITTTYDGTSHLVSITNNSRTTNYSSGSTQITLSSTAPIENHVYAYLANTDEQGISISQTNGNTLRQTDIINTVFKGVSGATGFRLRVTNLYDFVSAHPINNTFSFYLNIIDLTQAFGEYLAEYLYSLTDHGISIVKQIFTKDYYAYDVGGTKVSIESVNGSPYPNASVSWQSEAGTVYGGSYRSSDKKLIDDRDSEIINNLTTSYYSTGSINYLYGSLPNKYSTSIGDTEHPLMFEMLDYGGCKYSSQFTDMACYQTSGLNFYIVDNSCSSKSDFLTKYGTARLVWYRATPVEYTITGAPPTPNAIVRTNNVFTDTNGNTSVVYACSLKDYIDNQ